MNRSLSEPCEPTPRGPSKPSPIPVWRSRPAAVDGEDVDQNHDAGIAHDDATDDDDREQDAVPPVDAAAAVVLPFNDERGPAALAAFMQLRVVDPEDWRRGIEAAARWPPESGGGELRVPYTYVTPEVWPGVGSLSLAVYIADQRRYYSAKALKASRVAELERLGMVWSLHASEWGAGHAVAHRYAALHGHCLPAASAVWDSFNGRKRAVKLSPQRRSDLNTLGMPLRRMAGLPGAFGSPATRLSRTPGVDGPGIRSQTNASTLQF